MKTIKFSCKLIFVSWIWLVSIKVSCNDSLRLSLGYGSLFGGGLGIKYSWPLLPLRKLHFHVGLSGGLLNTTFDEYILERDFNLTPQKPDNKAYRLVFLYWLIPKLPYKIVYPQSYDVIIKNRLLIPFSFNLSYTFSPKFSLYLGYGIIGKGIFQKLVADSHYLETHNNYLQAAVVHKLSSINLTPVFTFGKTSLYFSLSGFIIPLTYKKYDIMWDMYFQNSILKRCFTFSLGCYVSLNTRNIFHFTKRLFSDVKKHDNLIKANNSTIYYHYLQKNIVVMNSF